MKILETDRLYLRELRPEDKADWMQVLCDPESMVYYPTPFTEEKVEQWIAWNLDNYERYGHGLWAVILKEGEIFLGDCGMTMQDIGGEIVPEIGFHIIKKYCGRGYATEAALACMEYAFNTLNYTKVYSYSALRNLPSQRVAKKMGMKEYKRFEKNGEAQIAHIAIR